MNNDFKKCPDCNIDKPLSDFFKSSCKGRILFTTRCKPCHNKWSKEYRHSTKGKEIYKKWSKTVRGKEVIKKRMANWHKKNTLKHNAQTTSYNAIRDKRLIPKPCVICKSLKVEAHHPNYCKPLDIIWLCKKHHMALHYSS